MKIDKPKLKRNIRQILLFLGEDGYYVAECPSLPGCISQGASRQEAIANIKEAIEHSIEVLYMFFDESNRSIKQRLIYFITAEK